MASGQNGEAAEKAVARSVLAVVYLSPRETFEGGRQIGELSSDGLDRAANRVDEGAGQRLAQRVRLGAAEAIRGYGCIAHRTGVNGRRQPGQNQQ